MPKISLIVAVYGVEKYLTECVLSLTNQNFSDIEIILVDDGSPDNSPKMCDEFAKKDPRIKVIHKKNGGASDARNVGVEAATGDVFAFVDGDDLYAKDVLRDIAKLMDENPDVIVGRWETFSDEGFDDIIDEPFDVERIKKADRKDFLDYYMNVHTYTTSQSRYFIKRSFYNEKNMKFIVGINHEDEDWTMNLLLNANSFRAYQPPFYLYRRRAGTKQTKKHFKSEMDKLNIASDVSKYLSSDSVGETEKKYIRFKQAEIINYIIGISPRYSLKEIDVFADSISKFDKTIIDEIQNKCIAEKIKKHGINKALKLNALSIKIKRLLKGKKISW